MQKVLSAKFLTFVCVIDPWLMILVQKESTIARSKTEEKDDHIEDWNKDEKLEVVHGEPKHHRGESEVEEASNASSQREWCPLISASKEAFRTKQQQNQLNGYY